MADQFLVKVNIIISSVEDKAGNAKFLLVDNNNLLECPNNFLVKENTTKDIAIKLLEKYTGISENWVVLLHFGIVEDPNPNKDTVNVLYGVYIPEETRIKVDDSRWVSYSEVNLRSDLNSITKKIIYESMWRNV